MILVSSLSIQEVETPFIHDLNFFFLMIVSIKCFGCTLFLVISFVIHFSFPGLFELNGRLEVRYIKEFGLAVLCSLLIM